MAVWHKVILQTDHSKPVLRVVVGIALDADQKILVARRPFDKSYPGLWEFPGGKIESNEQPLTALVREMQEELGIQVKTAYFWGEAWDVQETFSIHFFVYSITQFEGQPMPMENQPEIDWVACEALEYLNMPPANEKILDLIIFRNVRRLERL